MAAEWSKTPISQIQVDNTVALVPGLNHAWDNTMVTDHTERDYMILMLYLVDTTYNVKINLITLHTCHSKPIPFVKGTLVLFKQWTLLIFESSVY